MSYTNPNGAATYTQTAALSGAIIADDQYVVDPYAKTLTLQATGTDITVVSGGKVSLAADKRMDNAIVSAGGSIACGVRPYFYNLTVESGGKVTLGTGAHFSGFTTFGTGAITNYTAAYTVDGVIHNLIVNGQNLHLNKGADAVDVIVRANQFCVSAGVTAENVVASGGSVVVYESGTVKTLTVSSGGKLDIKVDAPKACKRI